MSNQKGGSLLTVLLTIFTTSELALGDISEDYDPGHFHNTTQTPVAVGCCDSADGLHTLSHGAVSKPEFSFRVSRTS